MSLPSLHIKDLTVAYNNKLALWQINASIPRGVMLALVGPNGAGKSTLLKTIVQLLPSLAGTVTVLGKPYEKNSTALAYIPQRSTIDWDFPITVLEVVLMGTYHRLGWFVRPGAQEYADARAALESVALLHLQDRPINSLSGGEQQRMFLARALVQDAQVYLMDEPFFGVDTTTETIILSLLQKLKDAGKTIVVVHHDLQTVHTYFDWVMLLNVKTVALGPRDQVFTKHNIHTAYGQAVCIPTLQGLQ